MSSSEFHRIMTLYQKTNKQTPKTYVVDIQLNILPEGYLLLVPNIKQAHSEAVFPFNR